MPKVVHFEIPADNPDRAVKFYTSAFGWKINKWSDQAYWLIDAGAEKEPGINGAITTRESLKAVTNTIGVGSIEDARAKVRASGGKVTTEIVPIPGIGRFCYCQDTEGNSFGILQPDMPAK